MKSYGKVLLLLALICYFPIGLSAEEEVRSLWCPGWEYTTQIKYQFVIENCRIVPSDGMYSTSGKFITPRLIFSPHVFYKTEDVTRNGNNFYARRRYEQPICRLTGTKDIKWENNHWYNFGKTMMVFNKEAREFKKFFNEIEEAGGVAESFQLFDVMHDKASFDPTTKSLFFSWSDKTFDDLLFRTSKKNNLDVFLGGHTTPARDGVVKGAPAGSVIRDIIRSEWNLSAAALCDDAVKKRDN